ncbi:hypothetical protein GCM10010260_01150 [Streptomyces filipinensis]|uniref:Uncharacterized protein n=1 Tax=Streptomyces filipinensis TaxID=66887 RepID=A0A918M7L7_9ACTN|nr:hypothetical protein GCM10010260_01150 [Streptomyces filipinensis]
MTGTSETDDDSLPVRRLCLHPGTARLVGLTPEHSKGSAKGAGDLTGPLRTAEKTGGPA